jgi:hypothetical protein
MALPPRLATQLRRFASESLLDSSAMAALWDALVAEEQQHKAPTWAQRVITQVVELLTAYETLNTKRIRLDALLRERKVQILRKAAAILRQYCPGAALAVARKRNVNVDYARDLDLIARLVRRAETAPLPASYLGERGRAASDRRGARRGAVIRKLDELIPTGLPRRYTAIASLLTVIGEKTSPQLVRSTLKRGKT